jgi:F-type H+-transporting ATPase subunit alpha
MKDFNYYLENVGEIGFVESSVHSLTYVSGLPKVHPGEVVIFESQDFGQVLSLSKDYAEILVLTNSQVRVGSKVVRTGEHFRVQVGPSFLGRTINPLGYPIDSGKLVKEDIVRAVDITPLKILERREVEKPLQTGVSIVDMVVPLAKGQRELVIGDRKTGKTDFLFRTMVTQATSGAVCIYAVIGQKLIDIRKLSEFFKEQNVMKNTLIIASSSSDPAGLIYLTPFTAMTHAEHFRDQGMDVVLILDDMTSHARNYREISLLAKRFPGRGSSPGDIFYLHARLVERAGNFKKGSITLIPVAESVLGDLSGYIQTNLMAMTDGHIFFDIELYNQGKRPSVNPFLSVTRVGHQTQTALQKDVSREISSFLVTYERMKQFLHFGAEVGETAQNILALGERLDSFFNQNLNSTLPTNVNIVTVGSLWAGIWNETSGPDLKKETEMLLLSYQTDDEFRKKVDELILQTKSFSELVSYLRRSNEFIIAKLGRQ